MVAYTFGKEEMLIGFFVSGNKLILLKVYRNSF